MRTQVKEISHKGSSSVIEWHDGAGNVKRSILPSSQIIHENSQLYVENPDEGALYGAAWETLITVVMGPKEIAALLRKNNIWTFEDYLSRSSDITSIFNEACSVNKRQFQQDVLGHIQVQGRK